MLITIVSDDCRKKEQQLISDVCITVNGPVNGGKPSTRGKPLSQNAALFHASNRSDSTPCAPTCSDTITFNLNHFNKWPLRKSGSRVGAGIVAYLAKLPPAMLASLMGIPYGPTAAPSQLPDNGLGKQQRIAQVFVTPVPMLETG